MISILSLLKLAVATLWTNKLRSFLTLLGMLFGTAAVIATLSSNEGAARYLASQLESLGNNVLVVFVQDNSIKITDKKLLERYVPELKETSLEYVVPSQTVTYEAPSGIRSGMTQYIGIEDPYFDIQKLALSRGRMFNDSDIEADTINCIVGQNVAKSLLGDIPPIGERIIASLGTNTVAFNIIGVLKEKGGPAGTQLDNAIYLPANLLQRLFKNTSKATLVMSLHDDNQSARATSKARTLLTPKYSTNLNVSDSREAIERTRSIWQKQNQVGIILAGVSLLTGGVGIMNIMLLSIAQRRKEIGLRKAVGARNIELATQFLLEAVIICLIGGALGILVGWGFGQKVAQMMGQWEAVTSIKAIGLALGFSAATGIFFGLFPAIRASKIDPYDALRSS